MVLCFFHCWPRLKARTAKLSNLRTFEPPTRNNLEWSPVDTSNTTGDSRRRAKWSLFQHVGMILGLLFALIPAGQLVAQEQAPSLLPAVSKVTLSEGATFKIDNKLTYFHSDDIPFAADHMQVFSAAITSLNGSKVTRIGLASSAVLDLSIRLDESLAAEEYRITINAGILIQASSLKGLAHATATLLQLWGDVGEEIPNMVISDAPAVSYRNFMVDLGRNPHSLTVLKETIDLLWFYKLDSLQLHLTDDQYFAFPSTAFPKLASKNQAISLDEFKELERYAVVRGISIIPELEAPGHSSILRREYPETFGTTPTEVATLPSSRAALKTILDEMVDVFASSPYVHVGGDEAYGVPVEFQRDLVNELNAHLKTRGKTAVVWEGPALGEGDNKIDEDVIHINWRTIDFPAPEMLKAGYPVVNAAWDPLYLVDHYPRNNFTMASPGHIYQQLDRFLFRHFNPGMPTFAKPISVQPTDQVIGYCMPWWEGREENYLHLVAPRLIAMAAVAWSEPSHRDVDEFEKRSEQTEAARTRAFYPVTIAASNLAVESAGVFHEQTFISLLPSDTLAKQAFELRYTIDGSEPNASSIVFEEPISIQQNTLVRAAAFFDGKQLRHGSRRKFVHVSPVKNLALGKAVAVSVAAGPLFCPQRLTDGGIGNLDYFLGYPASEQHPIEITIDLGGSQSIQRVVVNAYTYQSSYESYEILVSANGKDWLQVAERFEKPEQAGAVSEHEMSPVSVRYIRLNTRGHKGQVFDSFSRITEIQVY